MKGNITFFRLPIRNIEAIPHLVSTPKPRFYYVFKFKFLNLYILKSKSEISVFVLILKVFKYIKYIEIFYLGI